MKRLATQRRGAKARKPMRGGAGAQLPRNGERSAREPQVVIRVCSSHAIARWAITQALAADVKLRPLLDGDDERRTRGAEDLTVLVVDTCSDTNLPKLKNAGEGLQRAIALLGPADDGHRGEEMLRLLYCGADAVVMIKAGFASEVAKALKAVVKGKLWFPHEVLTDYVQQTSWLNHAPFHLGFTPRETQIWQLLVRRYSNKQISSALQISERTVKFHVGNVLAKASVTDRGALLQKCFSASTFRFTSLDPRHKVTRVCGTEHLPAWPRPSDVA